MIDNISITKNYSWFFRNMDNRSKLELINWLSGSLLETQKEDNDDFFDCFGAFISDKSAEEQIEEIRSSRHFSDKTIEL